MMSKTTAPGDNGDRPTTAEEIVDKYGEELLEEMAEEGNIAAGEALELARERRSDDAE